MISLAACESFIAEFLNGEPEIERWIDNPPQLTSRLSEIHYNFYQVLAGVTHCMSFKNRNCE